MKKFKNKAVVITGGSGAIGATVAKAFLEEGAKVLIVDVNSEQLEKTAKELDHQNLFYKVADVSRAKEVEDYVNYAVDTLGKIDVFFNNAGIEGIVKPMTEYPEDMFDKVMAVNVKGVWLGMKYVIPQMNNGGSIINTSSVAGLEGSPNMTAYIASKHAVVGLTRVAAIECAPRKIRVNTVHPSPVDNRMMRSLEEGFAPGEAAKMKKQFESGIPLGRYADNEDIKDAVIFLASDESKFMTGTKMVVDGGQTMF